MFKRKTLITLVSLLAILCVTVGGTLAFIMDTDGPINNIFNPTAVTTAVVETLDQEELIKKDVKIQNTGSTDAYIRAAVVVTWQDEEGNVYGQKPVEGTDYEITWTKQNWDDGNDGFYYYTEKVSPNGVTSVLFTDCKPKSTAPEGYSLAVEIIGSGIQAKGETSNGTKPVVDAWSVTMNGDKISK